MATNGRKVERVSAWREKGGFGFTTPSGAFIHLSDLEERDRDSLEVGTRVSFDLEETSKGPRARCVRIES